MWLQTRYNEEDERAIVNGAHTNATLQQLVHKYVELFVLCPNCRLPESSEYRVCPGFVGGGLVGELPVPTPNHVAVVFGGVPTRTGGRLRCRGSCGAVLLSFLLWGLLSRS